MEKPIRVGQRSGKDCKCLLQKKKKKNHTLKTMKIVVLLVMDVKIKYFSTQNYSGEENNSQNRRTPIVQPVA
jgi:predicted nucleic acid-binding Zn ribbon protein